jgi:hypothetical protein
MESERLLWRSSAKVTPRAAEFNRPRTISAVRAPPITIACECGEMEDVPYGQTWECRSCGRRWNTGQIPADEYWGIMREMRRYRLSVIGIALAFSLAFALLAIFVTTSLFLLLPVVLALWFIWYMPAWRRKVRRRARDLPKWKLRPE